jgi:hypothetical protein
LRNAMHPPKANRPASDIYKGDKIYQVVLHRYSNRASERNWLGRGKVRDALRLN